MAVRDFWAVEVSSRDPSLDPRGEDCRTEWRELSAPDAELPPVEVSDLYLLESKALTREAVDAVAQCLLHDPVTQAYHVFAPDSPVELLVAAPGTTACVVMKKAGVMDPVAETLAQSVADLGFPNVEVRTGARWCFAADLEADARRLLAEKVLANPVIEEVDWGGGLPGAPFRSGLPYEMRLTEVPLEDLSEAQLAELSRDRGLSLSGEEMLCIQNHFAELGRAPSDAELETLAQTWSEHCCHKTLTSAVEHTRANGEVERFENLLQETVFRATREIDAPWCLSVFEDNAGVIALDSELALTFKVETHNHPSAIEPYGGAGTGIGGVLRDTLGTGLGAKPIASTDVFCFGPPDLPAGDVPPGALHPLRVLRGVVGGVRDYGNRMGIPTASGAVYFDRRYAGNPLVFCGSVGLIPRWAIDKEARPGDRVYVLGGRTGRDGIHGATFSSAELTEESETVSSGAVQIGNPICEKKLLDVLLQARDRRLYRAVTDCGAGGLSSAVGEMGAHTGAEVELDLVPLKYAGLTYWEIWISEAQERMVLAVPPECARELEALARSEDVECTGIGAFTDTGELTLRYGGEEVCRLSMAFLHGGRPRRQRVSVEPERATAELDAPAAADLWPSGSLGAALHGLLGAPNIASKEWIIRQYDHEVQGGSVLKPLQGEAEDGPGDGVAFLPCPGSRQAIVIGCGMNPCYGEHSYRMALSAVDEAIRNVVAAGGDPARTALLDNFCWGNTERPETLGSIVEAAKGCYDAAVAFRTPFISGKDSLNNELRVGDRTLSIPPTLLISSLALADDVARLASMDLKRPGSRLIIAGRTFAELGGSHLRRWLGVEGGEVPDVRFSAAAHVHAAVHEVLRRGWALSCHDLSEGGLGIAAAEMAFAGGVGAEIDLQQVDAVGCDGDATVLFSESNSRYLLEVAPEREAAVLAAVRNGEIAGVSATVVGRTLAADCLRVRGGDGSVVLEESLATLKSSWKTPLSF